MRIDELQRDLASARDDQLAADALAGRRGVDRRVRRHRVQRAGLAVLVVVLLVGTGVFIASRGNDEQRVISGPGDIPHYLPDPLPAGAPTVRLYPIDEATTDTAISTVVGQYEAAWTSDPAAEPGPGSPFLLLRVIPIPNEAITPRPVESQTIGDTVLSHWVDDLGRAFFVMARSVDPEQFAATLASVRLSDDGIPTLTPPPGFRQVASFGMDARAFTQDYFESAAGLLGVVDPSASGYIAAFGGLDDRITPAIAVSTRPSSHAWLLARFEFDNVEPTSVRGRAGYLRRMSYTDRVTVTSGQPPVASTRDLGVVLFWWESDGLMLATLAATEDEARAMADSLRAVGEDEWDEFLASAEDGAATSETTVP